jgi:hypothetical protein
MLRIIRIAAFPAAVALATLTLGTVLVIPTASADQSGSPPPPQNDSPRTGNRQQWEACRKQADAQQLPRGDARREFMRNCIKSAQSAPAQPASL